MVQVSTEGEQLCVTQSFWNKNQTAATSPSVPALAGCVSQGSSRAEALANIREAIELYVEDCRDAGDPVPTEVGKEFVELIDLLDAKEI